MTTPSRILLRSPEGLEAELTAFGARLLALRVPDRDGRLADVALGTDDPDAVHGRSSYFGATCGRFANRIRDGRFVLDGVEHRLSVNEGSTHLHGGAVGFDRCWWSAQVEPSGRAVEFTLTSPDGDQGYPGALTAHVRYALEGKALRIAMTATTSATTIVNLANHAYWNLSGDGNADMLDHDVTIHATHWLPVDERLIPTGEIRTVDGGAFDFRAGRRMSEALAARPEGFDHCLVVEGPAGRLRPVARVLHAGTGRGFELYADQPGLQFYTCMHFGEGLAGKAGALYRRFAGLVFEPQGYPDAPNQPGFPSARLAPGEVYRQALEYRFFW